MRSLSEVQRGEPGQIRRRQTNAEGLEHSVGGVEERTNAGKKTVLSCASINVRERCGERRDDDRVPAMATAGPPDGAERRKHHIGYIRFHSTGVDAIDKIRVAGDEARAWRWNCSAVALW